LFLDISHLLRVCVFRLLAHVYGEGYYLFSFFLLRGEYQLLPVLRWENTELPRPVCSVLKFKFMCYYIYVRKLSQFVCYFVLSVGVIDLLIALALIVTFTGEWPLCSIPSDEKMGLSLMNTTSILGLSSSMHYAHIACYWKILAFALHTSPLSVQALQSRSCLS
jgi:vacuolar-type H+-ATPase subunit I/STV1